MNRVTYDLGDSKRYMTRNIIFGVPVWVCIGVGLPWRLATLLEMC